MKRLHLASTAGVLVLVAWGIQSLTAGSSRAPDVPTDAGDVLRGPELIVEYFRQWHAPYPADLDRATLERIWREIDRLPAEGPRRGALPWQPLGPFGMTTPGGGRNSGRIVDLDVGPDGIRAAAAASGGVWRRDAGGWQALTDQLTTQWTGSLDICPADPATMLVGTGEPFIRAGTGLWKTTDGGATWSHKPMSPPPATCFRVRYADNGTVVHGAFDLGYYRSSDGGETWTRRLNLGAWPTDMALHPTNSNVLYLTLYDHGLFRSTNGGFTWSEVMGAGLPQSDIGRGAITICESDPDRLYVAYSRPGGNLLGVFRTSDGGTTWTDVSPPQDYFWGQGWYNNTIAVSPTDPDMVLAGGGELIRSTDGGDTWLNVSSPGIHADHHASVWSEDGTEVWLGHDGGWSHSTDAGVTWSGADNTLAITQYVLIGASPNVVPFVIGGGSQDNGISITTDGGASWFFGHGGDGGGFAVHHTHPNTMVSTAGIYSGIWPFRRLKSFDGGASWTQTNSGIGVGSQWWTRMRTDRGVPPSWYTYGDGFVYRSADLIWWSAMNSNPMVFPHFVSELTVSHAPTADVTVYACLDSDVAGERLMVWDGAAFQERSSGLPGGVRVRKVATHPRDPDVAFAIMNGMGTPGQKVYRTADRGLSWINVTGDLPDVPIADVVAHPTEEGRLFLGSEMGAFHSTDGGATWERWHMGLPEAVVITELTFVDRVDDTGELFILAGTYGRGVWVREVGDLPVAVPGNDEVSAGVVLHAGTPNPFREATSISFTLSRPARVTLRVFDVSGREVSRLVDGTRGAGAHRVHLDGRGLSPGVYFVELETDAGRATRRITRTG